MKLIFVTHHIGGGKNKQHYEDKGIEFEYLILPDVVRKYRFLSKRGIIWREFKALIKLLLNIHKIRGSKVYSIGGQYGCMFIFRIFGPLLGKDSHLYIHNFYLHNLGKHNKVKKVLRFLMNGKNMTLIVQTPGEEEYYRNISDKIDIRFVPYCMDYFPNSVPDEGYIFTGGYTNRDYNIMAELSNKMTDENFVFVMSQLNGNVPLPRNVKVYKDIPGEEFQRLLVRSKMVIVPLKDDVGSSGQMLCLQSMRSAKPIVYSDVSSINYYFTPTSGYPYKIGDITSLYRAVKDALANTILNAGSNAYEESLKYTKEKEQEMIDAILGI